MEQYESILNAKDLHDSLCEHFTYLSGQNLAPVLSAVMKKATGVKVFDGNLVVSFTDKELYASAPGDMSKYEKWPASFQEYVARHEYLSFGTDLWELCLGNRKSFHSESRLLSKYNKSDILIPVINSFTFQMWLYHPEEKNSAGENMIYHFAPNTGADIDSPTELCAGQIFLKQMAFDVDVFI